MEDRKEYYRNYYKTHKAQRIEGVNRNRRKLMAWFKEYKKSLSCQMCGENHPACLDFHHRDPATKKHEVSTISSSYQSKKGILEEIDKCDVLCSNCHRKLHYKP